MAQLNGGVLPDPDAGRDALQDGALGGPDQGAGATAATRPGRTAPSDWVRSM